MRPIKCLLNSFLLLLACGCGSEMAQVLSNGRDAATSQGRDAISSTAPASDLPPTGSVISGGGSCSVPIVIAEGSRYISMAVQPPGGASPVALWVTSPNYPGVQHYVSATGVPGCGSVSRTPDEWGTVHLHGFLIVPSTPYTVQADCGGDLLSPPVTVTTWRYGDVNNSATVNIDDILCVLGGFSGNFGTCSLYADDQLPFDPNGIVNLDDILAILAAFSGATYPGPLPPSTPVIPAPALNAHATMVNTTPLPITGSAPGAVAVEFANHFGVFQATMGANGTFSASVALAENRVNPVYFTAIDACGTRSAPTLTTITHDSEPPNLFIDFPSDSAEVTIPATDVAGRVGDVLSGFMGLTVKITCPACPPQGINAVVDVGLGNNGTFNASNVPLNLGANVINATATDALGNQTIRQITITRTEIPPNTPQMMVLSGNGQSAPVHQFLPNPITVKVLKANGSPFVNKVVTFKVTRSDGRLVGEMAADCYGDGTMMLQCHTDANGEVRAMWKLGSDAGCGNNRVEVTSTSIAGTVAFCASAMPGPASQINIGSGNNQRVEIHASAPEPLRARVSDSCNGIANLGVTFTVTQGGGKVKAVGGSTWLDNVTVPTTVTGHASVEYLAGPNKGNQLIEANFAGNTTNPATFVAYAIQRDESQPTSFSGLVFDNALQPIGGAQVKLVLAGRPPMITLTTEQGQFSFPDVDGSGPSDLFVDGAVATMLNGQPIPTGSFPFLHYTPVLVPNAANALAAPAMLPPLDPCNQVIYDGSQDVTLTIRMRDPATPTCDPQQSGCCIPAIEGLEMLVKAGTTIRRPDGKCVGPDASCSGPDDIGQMTLALNQVHHDDVPMPMPDGAAPPFAWTLQPGGSTFDIPVQVTYPNMSALPAGSIAYFLSFDHDANKFQVIATGHVSGDGASIITDPNAGITKAGWGCNCPPYSVTGKCCTGCGDVCCDGVCCSSTCCANGQTCCGGSCCDGQCCAGVCCAGAGTCCEGSCCADGQTCCGSTCCASGEECCIDQCVPEEDCGASSVTQTLSVTFPGLDLFTNALETAAEAAPMISSMELSVSASISAESGETCCECTEPTGAGPFGYTDYAASVSADLEITFNIPGWAWDVGFTFSGYGSIAGMVTLGPTVTLTPSAGVSVAGRDIPEADCPEECTRVDGTANIGLQVLFGGSATVTVSVEPTWIWDGWGTSVEATAQAGVGTSAGISGTYRLSNCSAPGFSTDGICFGDLEGVVVLKFVIFGTEFSYQATAQFLEGGCW